MADTPALLVHELSFTYRGAGRPALEAISLEAGSGPGELVVVLGASGAGKSTLCLTLNGLIPHFIRGEMTGEVRVLGESTRERTVSQLAAQVGLLFQEFESQLFCSSVELEVAFGPENLELPPEEIRHRVTEALATVGLAGLERRDPTTLSGGQKQRLAMAAVLALQPRVLVMDEPTTDLDPAARADLFAMAQRLCREEGLTIVLAEQETAAATHADRVLVLQEGRIAGVGAAADVLSRVDWLHQHGVAPPPVAELMVRLGEPVEMEVDAAADQLQAQGYGVDPATRQRLHADDQARCRSYGELLFELHDLEFCYPNGTKALAGIDLHIRDGEFVALVGPNGSGKTTLARHLNGLLRPTRGAVKVAGSPALKQSTAELGRVVGYVFQNPDHQLFAETVAQEVAFGPSLRGLSPGEVEERVTESLAAVGLTGREDEDPFSMTKGERQRVAVASVLATRPRALILDEPTTGLDYEERRSLMSLVRRLNEAGHTIICITHHIEVVTEYAHRVVALRSGRVHLDGLTREIMGQESELAAAAITPPNIARLGSRFGVPFLTVDEAAGALCRPVDSRAGREASPQRAAPSHR